MSDSPKFDRSKITHISAAHGYALANGCQGIFVDEIFLNEADALARWRALGRDQHGADEQVVRVRVTVDSEFEPTSKDDALATAEAWLDRWAAHVGSCEGFPTCTCGLAVVLNEVRLAMVEN